MNIEFIEIKVNEIEVLKSALRFIEDEEARQNVLNEIQSLIREIESEAKPKVYKQVDERKGVDPFA